MCLTKSSTNSLTKKQSKVWALFGPFHGSSNGRTKAFIDQSPFDFSGTEWCRLWYIQRMYWEALSTRGEIQIIFNEEWLCRSGQKSTENQNCWLLSRSGVSTASWPAADFISVSLRKFRWKIKKMLSRFHFTPFFFLETSPPHFLESWQSSFKKVYFFVGLRLTSNVYFFVGQREYFVTYNIISPANLFSNKYEYFYYRSSSPHHRS